MQWYFLDGNQQQVPADESELSGLVQSGMIASETMLWNETLSEWQSASSLFPTWFPEPAPAQAAPAGTGAPVMRRAAPKLAGVQKGPKLGMVKRTIHTDHDHSHGTAAQTAGGGIESQDNREMIKDFASFIGVNAGWMKFLGVMNIIIGVFNCITVVGALWGWIPIWLGVIMFKAANAAFSAQFSGSREDLEESLDRVSFFFKLQGILMLIWVIFTVLSIVFYIVFGAAVLMSIQQGMGSQLEMPME